MQPTSSHLMSTVNHDMKLFGSMPPTHYKQGALRNNLVEVAELKGLGLSCVKADAMKHMDCWAGVAVASAGKTRMVKVLGSSLHLGADS